MSQIVLAVMLLFMLWLFVKDVQRRPGVSHAIWMVVIWAVIIGSRPVSSWFSFSGETGSAAMAYDEGNPFERYVYFILIIGGIVTLMQRRFRLSDLSSRNRWLVLFFVYWGCSLLWADSPFVSFKRWVKDVGNIIMLLVVLTEKNPVEAIKAVFARCTYVLVPASVLMIKYYPDLGRAYHVWSGGMMYTGVATHKNSLGALVLVCALFCFWDFLDRTEAQKRRKDMALMAGQVVVLLMTVWLLIKAQSATALACTFLGLCIFLGLRLPAIRKRVGHLGLYLIFGPVLFLVLDSMFGLVELVVVHGLGRDMTLTTRTAVWPMLLSQSSSALFGSGFNSFWTGERLALIYEKLGIIQAHNGYLETYLNGGMIGCLLLLAVLVASFNSIKKEILAGGYYGNLRLSFFVIAIVYNFTEATFDKVSLLWFVQLLVCVEFPRARQSVAAKSPARSAPEPATVDAGMPQAARCESGTGAV